MTKWTISLNPNTQTQAKNIQQLPVPFGYSLQTTSPHVQSPKKKQMIENKLFEVATSPKMQIFTAFLLMYLFIGNTVSIYSIFAVFQFLFNSISSIIKTNKTFEPYETMTKSMAKYKLIYVSLNFLVFGVVLHKLSKMGLLSFSQSAYIDMIPPYLASSATVSI